MKAIPMKLADVYAAAPVLARLRKAPMKAALRYRVAKATEELVAEVRRIEEVRTGLFQRLGVRDKGQWKVEGEAREQLLAEFNELLATEGTVQVDMLTRAELDAADVTLSVEEDLALVTVGLLPREE